MRCIRGGRLKRVKSNNHSYPTGHLTKKASSFTESSAIHEIIKFLVKVPNSRLFRNYNAVPYSVSLGRYIRKSSSLNPAGIPDLTFHFKGKTIYFEVKSELEWRRIDKNIDKYRMEINTPSVKHIKDQIRLMDDLNAIGIPSYFVCNVEQVDTILQNIFGIDYLSK